MIRQSKQFGMVTTEIIRDPTLSVTAKAVYALLSTYANKKSMLSNYQKHFPKDLMSIGRQ